MVIWQTFDIESQAPVEFFVLLKLYFDTTDLLFVYELFMYVLVIKLFKKS